MQYRRKLPVKTRFYKYLTRGDNCWNWNGIIDDKGYGRFCINRDGKWKVALAHRVSYELHIGPIPEGMGILHRCDNPRCVNPKHLFPGTQQDNVNDMIAKGRQATPEQAARKGEENGRAKLSGAKVALIRKYRGKVQRRKLAAIFGVTESTIRRIWIREIWK